MYILGGSCQSVCRLYNSFITLQFHYKICSGNYDILSDQASPGIFSALLELADQPHTVLWKSDRDRYEDTFLITVDAYTRVELCFELSKDALDDMIGENGLSVGFNYHVRPDLERTLPEGTCRK
jgi:hypothetical protein